MIWDSFLDHVAYDGADQPERYDGHDPAETKWHPAEPSPIIALINERRKKG